MASRKKNNGDSISWALIVILFAIGIWPIALVLLFAKLFAPDEKRKQTAPPPLREETAVNQTSAYTAGKSSGRAARAAKSVTRQPKMKKSNARLLQIFGCIIALFSLLVGADYISWFLSGDAYWLPEVLQALAWAAGGVGMFVAGRKMSRAMKRYTRYLAVMGGRAAVSVDELSRKLGYSQRQVEKDLRKMIDKDFFGDAAYLNEELGYFFRSAKADEELARKKAEEAAQPQTPKEAEAGFSGILREIRRANDRIADPVLSGQIGRLEDITARIFRAVEDDPAKLGRIGTFLNYYLPTTQKLLDSYAEFESAGVEGENLRQAKESIRKTMESIVEGFEHQLDALYKADAMDVDKDIRVMETMLRRDTASVAKDFGLGASGKVKSQSAPPAAESTEEDPLRSIMDTVAKTAVPKAAPKTTDVDLGGMAAQQMEE